jgi:hypothetical protein
MKKRLLLISPGRQAGGSNLLLARTSANLYRRHGYALTLVDYHDGATRDAWRKSGVEFDFFPYEDGAPIYAGEADVLLMNLLSSKAMPARLTLDSRTRYVSWCTAPQDGFKYIPPAHLFNRWSWTAKKAILRTFFRAHGARIAEMLREGAARGGVIFMDEHCHAVNEALFGPGIPPALVPICTGEPTLPPRRVHPATGKAFWVGRLADFKTESMIAATRALLNHPSAIREVVVIGDGGDEKASQARLAGFSVSWRGYVPPAALDQMIQEEADLVFGHATSLLEAAKLGIPSLLVDATYERIADGGLKAEWLHRCPAGYVGKISSPEAFIGRTISECLREFQADPAAIAAADHLHWLSHHHPEAVTDALARIIVDGDYTYGEFIASGASRPGRLGALIDWAKACLFRRIY